MPTSAKNTQSEMIGPDRSRAGGSGAVPLIFGGVVAAFLGFVAAWLFLGQNPGTGDAALTARIDALETEIATLPAAPDAPDLQPLSDAQAALDTGLSALSTDTTARFDALDLSVADIDSRITAVERAPSDDGAVTETAIASIEREMEGLRAEIVAQEARFQAMADEAAAALATAEALSTATQQEAETAAQAAIARAALARLQLALDSGTPFDEPLADLVGAGIEIPPVLSAAAETGVASLATLQTDFPDASRAALAAARASGDDETAGVLSNLFEARSVEPREGDDPNAVLSRVEVAVRENRLDDAMAEIDKLPESAAAPLADWLARTRARMDAAAAADTLDQSLNQ